MPFSKIIKNVCATVAFAPVFTGLISSVSFPVSATPIVIQAGVEDGFASGPDPATPSVDLSAVLGASQDFDLIVGVNGGTRNRSTAHTFNGLPSNIISANLQLRVQAGNDADVHTDGVILLFTNALSSNFVDDIAFARTFGRLTRDFGAVFSSAQPGLLKPSVEWVFGDDFDINLDLSALPLADGGELNLLPQLNTLQFLDVVVADETGVDFMKLTLEIDQQNNSTAVPEPGMLGLFGLGLAGIFMLRRRQRNSGDIVS